MNSPATIPAEARGRSLNGPVLARIRSIVPTLSPTAHRIANTVLAHPGDVLELTVSDLAERTNTSVGSVVRFCQDLELRGYQDLKLRLAAETTAATAQPETDNDSATAVAISTLRASVDAVQAASQTVDFTELDSIVETITGSSRVMVVGVGTSAPIAQDAAYRLRTHGISVDAPADAHIQHVAACLLTADSVCLAISHTGQTRETLTAVEAARDAGATTLAITSFHRSPLTELCDHVLVAGAAETATRLEARVSRLLHLAVIDAVAAAVAHTDPERARIAQNFYANAITDHRI
ncbi:MurR/RpiR family transcriptional regulator [Prauserella flavalba]|uniref:MurR/RpiR family transcriptional regulator n=1 Tax=Prauserella flavalba TaxID=1477506 RepID=UPI0036E3FA2C